MVCWLTGDVFNLISCFLLNQLLTQKVLGVVYTVCDITLSSQLAYYKKYGPRRKKLSPKVRPVEIMFIIFVAYVIISTIVWLGEYQMLNLEYSDNISSCPEEKEPTGAQLVAGNVIAYLSLPFYVMSRPMQIIKNYKRKSTEGVSVGMFIVLVSANATQLISLFTMNQERKVLVRKIPYILGALIPMLCDCTILFQFVYYNKLKEKRMAQAPSMGVAMKDVDETETGASDKDQSDGRLISTIPSRDETTSVIQ